MLVLEREASEKRGTSGKRSSMRGVQEGEEGVEEGGEWGVVTRERSGVENTAASRQGGQECHLEPSPGPGIVHQLSPGALVRCSCSSIASWNSAPQDKKKAVKGMVRQACENDIPIFL
jgi:hypothetical protein